MVTFAAENGADLINDIGALPDAENARALAAEGGPALVIMHGVGAPKEPHRDHAYADFGRELLAFFKSKLALARGAGLAGERVVLDPGIEFAKGAGEDVAIFHELANLHRLGRPLLLPVSRKSVIHHLAGSPAARPEDRDPGTVALAVAAHLRGAHILRVHNARATYAAVKVIGAVKEGSS